jgi:hypothetical protein
MTQIQVIMKYLLKIVNKKYQKSFGKVTFKHYQFSTNSLSIS